MGYSPRGCKESDTTKVTSHARMRCFIMCCVCILGEETLFSWTSGEEIDIIRPLDSWTTCGSIYARPLHIYHVLP